MNWIPIDMSLPNAGKLVVVYLKAEGDLPEKAVVAQLWHGTWMLDYEERLEDKYPGRTITHWCYVTRPD